MPPSKSEIASLYAGKLRFGTQSADDLERARSIAQVVMEEFGDLRSNEEWDRWRKCGGWNDHASIQAALLAIRLAKLEAEPLVAAARRVCKVRNERDAAEGDTALEKAIAFIAAVEELRDLLVGRTCTCDSEALDDPALCRVHSRPELTREG